jgi:hypothetical protein
MATILPFRRPQPPHLRGLARCLACDVCWEAVAPVGVLAGLECPDCSLAKGVFVGLCDPEAAVRFVCDCGCDLFYILPHALQCLQCGVAAKGF